MYVALLRKTSKNYNQFCADDHSEQGPPNEVEEYLLVSIISGNEINVARVNYCPLCLLIPFDSSNQISRQMNQMQDPQTEYKINCLHSLCAGL